MGGQKATPEKDVRRRQRRKRDRRAGVQWSELLRELDAVVWEAEPRTLRFSFVSARAGSLLGYSSEQWLSEADFLAQHVHPEDRERVLEFYRNVAATGVGDNLEYRMVTREGNVRWLRDRVHAAMDAQGRVRQLRGVMVDTTSRRQAEEARARLAAILGATPDLVAIADVSGAHMYMNQAGRRMLGLAPEAEISDYNIADFSPAGVREKLLPKVLAAAAEDGTWAGESALLTADGLEIPVSQVVVAHKTPAGAIEYFSTIIRDMREWKRQEKRITTLLDVAKDISGTLDLDAILDRVQRHTARVLPCDAVLTFYWDRVRKRYRMIADYGVPPELRPKVAEMALRPDEGVAELLSQGRSVVLDESRDDEVFRQLRSEFRVTSLMATQLQVRGRALGGLVAVTVEAGRRFDVRQLELFEGVASQVAMAMEAVDLYRAQQDETRVFGALAHAAEEMIASLSAPEMLQRLCRVTTEVMECEFSHTFLWQPKEEAFVPVAGHGDSAEQWESLRLLNFPRKVLQNLLDALGRDGLVQAMAHQRQDFLPLGLLQRYGVSLSLYMPLRRKGEIVGIHSAGCRRRKEPFPARQERIARGIAQLASMALENARLVEELTQVNRLKSDFVATISHELRTPLNVIMGYTDLMREAAFGPVTPEQEETLGRMDRSACELLELIQATLDLSRLDAGRLPVEMREIEVEELVAEIDADTREVRDKPGVSFAWEVAADMPRVCTDPVKAKIIVRNLIGNAFKFTDSGDIRVTVDAWDSGIRFCVRDTGIGMSAQVQETIFEPFRQGDSSITRQYGGAGLGLYIVRRLVEMLGGTIGLESEVGRGSTFSVWLPCNAGVAAGRTEIGAA